MLKPWGAETLLTPKDSPYCMKILDIAQGHRLSLQSHTEKRETLVLDSGWAEITIEGETHPMHARTPYTIAPGTRHRVKALTACVIYEASTPETGRTIRFEDDYGRGDD